MRRIAVTGGIAEGKTTVLSYIRELGFETASADEIARLVFLEEQTQERLAALLRVRAPIMPEQLRAAIGSDPSVRRKANAVTHPRIYARLRAATAPFVEIPLLLEACVQGEFDRVWVVTCGPEEQLRRLSERLGSPDQASRLIRTQLPSSVKCAFADTIFRTNQPETHVQRSVLEAVRLEIG